MTQTSVFDTTTPNYFTLTGRLELLEQLCASFRCVTPSEVIGELAAGTVAHPELRDVEDMPWLGVVELSGREDLATFARFKRELGGGPTKNVGEAAVLAWCIRHEGTAIIDESRAKGIAEREGIDAHGALWLIQQGLVSHVLDPSAAETLIDELRAAGMHLPKDSVGLIA